MSSAKYNFRMGAMKKRASYGYSTMKFRKESVERFELYKIDGVAETDPSKCRKGFGFSVKVCYLSRYLYF